MPDFSDRTRWASLTGLTVMLVILMNAIPASAGSYATHSCHLPSGALAPTVGWTASGFSASQTTATDTCARAGMSNPAGTLRGVVSRDQSEFVPNDFVAWSYGAPQGTRITGYRAGFCAMADVASQGLVSIGPEANQTAPGTTLVYRGEDHDGMLGCRGGSPYWKDGLNYVERWDLSAARLWFMAWPAQGPPRDGSYDSAEFDIAAIRVLLREDHSPVVSRVSGSLASGDGAGVLEADFDATDVGAGLYRTIVEAKVGQSGEWRELDTRLVDSNAGRCEPVSASGGVAEFFYPVPCRLSITGSRAALDTAKLPAGDHLVRVQVEDAAGNRADVVPQRPLHVESPRGGGQPGGGSDQGRDLAPNNGAGASNHALVRLNRLSRTVDFRQPTHVIGRLVDERDRPIIGATLHVDWRRLVPRRGVRGAPWKALGTLQTTSTGRFRARLPATQSRAFRFSYRANVSQEGFTSASQYALSVRARVSLRAARATVRNGQVAAFSGRVAGAVPRGGVPLTLQAWVSGRGWTPARTERPDVRTDARGRFRVSYAFSQTYRRTRYRFRVRVGEDSAFPFSTNASRRVTVLVRP